MKGMHAVEAWDEQQIQTLLAQQTRPLQRYILAGLFGTGARLREFTNLKQVDFFTEEDGTLRISLDNFKNRKTHKRTVLLDKNFEAWLIQPITDWVNTFNQPESKLWQKSPRWLEHCCRKWFGKHPHFLRHCRSTYNYNYWNMTDMQNMAFMGWSNLQPAHIYTHLKTGDMKNVFKRKAQELQQELKT